jgi:hypothetical protein
MYSSPYRALYAFILFVAAVVLGMGLMMLPMAFASTSRSVPFESTPQEMLATGRDVLIEDLTVGSTEDDVYHRDERPGAVVRVVPWIREDGSYSLLAVTEVGWVYQAGDDPSEWTLIGRILEGEGLR